MEFRLLGPPEVLDAGGRPVVFRGRRPLAVLALLALRPNQPVSTQQLIHALWGTQPPRSARESIHFFVHQLRASLGEGAGMVRTRGASYLLDAAPEQVDVSRFLRLADEARVAHARGALELAWETSGQAAGLWRGPVLAGLHEPFAGTERARLEERRIAALEEQLRVGLELGRHAELTGELEALAAEHPLREGLSELRMVALYRSGRQAEALDAYQSARAGLVRHGIEPGDGLQRLQRAILSQDPSLDPPRPVPEPGTRPAMARPRHTGERSQTAPAPAPPTPPRPEVARPEVPRRDERRTVTALVVGVSARLREDPEEIRDLVARTADRVRALVGRYGGVVHTEAMGRMLAVFGALQSHEDDPERAVRAALDLRSEAGTAGIGVETGEVVVTLAEPGGRDQVAGHGELVTLAGEVLSVAAGLAAASGERAVLVGPRTHAATRRIIDYGPAPPAPGQDAPATPEAWVALTARARAGVRLGEVTGPLVERERELDILSGVVVRRLLRDREPQLVTLVGVPGVGKTRLVGELGRLLDRESELVVWRVGRCLPHGQGGLWALAEIVKAHAGILDTDAAAVTHDKLARATTDLLSDPAEADHTLVQLRALLGSPDELPAGDQTREPIAGWSRWFGAMAAQRPTVVVFEDLQWADEVLLDFVEQLPDQVGAVPLLVVGTGRLELLDRRPTWGGGQRDAATLSLPPLTREGTTKLLEAFLLLGQLRVPAATREALLGYAGGNPLYVEEYVRMLREREDAADGSDGSLPMPETVQQVIAARIDTLPVADKLLLQDAAVIGEVGWVRALASVSGRDPVQMEATLRRLVRLDFLRRVRGTSVGGETEYAFRHALIREVASSQVLRGERAAKHRHVAAWIQDLTSDPGDRADLIAYHYGQAVTLASASGEPGQELTDLARRASRAAGDRALALGALALAARHYQHALDLWPAAAPDRPELLVRLGQALVYSARSGATVLAEARDAAQAAGRPDLVVEADVLLSQLARTRGDERAAGQHAQRALRGQPENETPTPATVAALQSRAQYLLVQDRHDEAIGVAQQVIDLAQQLRLPLLEASGLSVVGHARIRAGDLGGVKDGERAIELVEAHRSPMLAFSHFGHAHTLWWYGDLDGCAAALAVGRPAVQATDAAIVSWFDGVQAALDYAAGRWAAVLATTDRALARQHTGQDAYMVTWHHTLRARVRLFQGDLTGALADAQAARDAGASGGETRYRQVASALLGRVLLAAGRRDEAVACLEALLAEQHQRPSRSCVTPDEAALLLDLNYPEDALPDGLPPTRWHQAVQALVARDLPRAVGLLTAVGSAVDAAQARLRHADQLAASGRRADARAVAHEAAAVLRPAGASRDLHRAEALAAAGGDEHA